MHRFLLLNLVTFGVVLHSVQVATTGNGDIRLRHGNYSSGTVEIYYNGDWGTICDDNWDLADANVVCRQLGLGPAEVAYRNAFYGEGTGPILLDEVQCSGYEERLNLCANLGWYNTDCSHQEDAGVQCSVGIFATTASYLVAGSVRLVGTSEPNEGRVEIYWDGEWKTVCDHYWDLNDANVVCQQLGYSYALGALGRAHFGQGSGDILLANVDCTGSESTLMQCDSSGLYLNDCGHWEDAGVVCATELAPSPPYVTLRLAGSNSPHEGRVEIYYKNTWGTICDDFWEYSDALVVCRQLGFSAVSTIYPEAHFGEGWGPILRGIDCSGNEDFWEDCNINDWDTPLCSHSEDAGVACTNADLFPTTLNYWMDGSVRLQGGSSPTEGRVEVYWGGEWNTVCDDFWDLDDAIVVCRQLGYPTALDAVGNAFFGEGRGDILLDGVHCNGYETNLMDCQYNTLYHHNCDHSEDAGVICTDSGYFQEGSVRLKGSSLQNQGRVEIFHYGSWGTVCDDGWDLTDADVVCKQLGFSGAYEAFDSAYFGEGETPILLDDVSCDGTEHYLADCSHNGWHIHNCDHREDAGVQCYIPEYLYPRLVNGTTWNEGRVEVWNSDHWEGVCAFSFYGNEASAVCQQLGFQDVETVYYWEKFGRNFASPSSIYFICDSKDKALSSCDQYQTPSTDCEATAIRCQQDNRLPGGAITGISFAVVTFFIMFVASCIIVYRQTTRKNRRSSPPLAVISGSENFTGSRSMPYQLLDSTTDSNVYGSPPPSYNDAVSHPIYYPPVNVSSPITSLNGRHALATQDNFIATRNYPMQPNLTVPNANPSSLAYLPPNNPTVNAEGSRHCPEQTYTLTRHHINDLPQPQPSHTSHVRNSVEANVLSAPDDLSPVMITSEGHADAGANEDQSQC